MPGELMGRRWLRFDALYCFGAGAIAIALSAPLSRLLHAPTGVLLGLGAATVVWAVLLRRLERRADWRRAVATVAAANVVAAAALGALAVIEPALAGQILLAAVAIEVAGFAIPQLSALRR